MGISCHVGETFSPSFLGEGSWGENVATKYQKHIFFVFGPIVLLTSNFSAEKTPEDSSFREGFSRSL